MKKQNSGIPNLLIISAIITLAFVASGCGVTNIPVTNPTPTSNSNNTNSQVPTTQNTVSKNVGSGMMGNGNVSGSVQNNNINSNSTNAGSGMMGNGNGNSMMTKYKDGNYSVSGQYFAPSGQEDIGVSLTLKNDIITDASVQANASNRTARAYQMMFTDSFKSQVVGQKISSLNLNRVAGASLTTDGFNNAIATIKSQATL